MGRRPTQSFPFTQGPRQERSQDRSLASLSSFSFPRPSSSSRTPVSPSSSPRSFSDSPVLHYTELVDPHSAPSPPVVPTRRSGLPIIPRRGNSITGSASYPSIPCNPVISEPLAPSTPSTPSLNRMQPDIIDISSPRSSMLYSPRTEEKLSMANSRKSIHVGEKGGNVNWARPLGRSRITKSPQLSEPEIDASMLILGQSMQRSRRLNRLDNLSPAPSPSGSISSHSSGDSTGPYTPCSSVAGGSTSGSISPSDSTAWALASPTPEGVSNRGLGFGPELDFAFLDEVSRKSAVGEKPIEDSPQPGHSPQVYDSLGYYFDQQGTPTLSALSTPALSPAPTVATTPLTEHQTRILSTSESLQELANPTSLDELRYLRQAASDLESEVLCERRSRADSLSLAINQLSLPRTTSTPALGRPSSVLSTGTVAPESKRQIKRKAVPSIQLGELQGDYNRQTPSANPMLVFTMAQQQQQRLGLGTPSSPRVRGASVPIQPPSSPSPAGPGPMVSAIPFPRSRMASSASTVSLAPLPATPTKKAFGLLNRSNAKSPETKGFYRNTMATQSVFDFSPRSTRSPRSVKSPPIPTSASLALGVDSPGGFSTSNSLSSLSSSSSGATSEEEIVTPIQDRQAFIDQMEMSLREIGQIPPFTYDDGGKAKSGAAGKKGLSRFFGNKKAAEV